MTLVPYIERMKKKRERKAVRGSTHSIIRWHSYSQ